MSFPSPNPPLAQRNCPIRSILSTRRIGAALGWRFQLFGKVDANPHSSPSRFRPDALESSVVILLVGYLVNTDWASYGRSRNKMSSSGKKSPPAVGFLTILRHEQYGLFGGYLILNPLGRPLEFHCTAPIKPNRAQEILYGPTLDAFLYGEQIGQTLLKQAGIEPLAICTDQETTLAVRDHTELPVALVLPQFGTHNVPPMTPGEANVPMPVAPKTYRIDGPHRAGPHLMAFDLGRNRLALPSRSDKDRQENHRTARRHRGKLRLHRALRPHPRRHRRSPASDAVMKPRSNQP